MEISNGDQKDTSPKAAEAHGPTSEHEDDSTPRKNQMGQSALALGLQDP
jgi:hypothetical protein